MKMENKPSTKKRAIFVVLSLLTPICVWIFWTPIAYQVVSVSEQHGKLGIWTSGATGEKLKHPVSYHICYRKRFSWLPSRDFLLCGLTKQQYHQLRSSALSFVEWDDDTTYGQAFYFIIDPTDLNGVPVSVSELDE